MSDNPTKKFQEDKENILVPSNSTIKTIKHYFPDENGIVYDSEGEIIAMCVCDLETKKNLDKNSKERPFWVQGLCMKHTHLWQKTKFVLSDRETKKEDKKMLCEHCDGGCSKCSCRWEIARDDLLLYLAQKFDEDNGNTKKNATRSVRYAAYTYYIKKIFGKGHLGKGNRVQAPTCVVDGIRENYKPENGKTTGFLAVCKSKE